MFIRGVDQCGDAATPTANDVDVIFDGPHDEAVHFGAGVRPDEFDVVNLRRLPRFSAGRTFANVSVTGITLR